MKATFMKQTRRVDRAIKAERERIVAALRKVAERFKTPIGLARACPSCNAAIAFYRREMIQLAQANEALRAELSRAIGARDEARRDAELNGYEVMRLLSRPVMEAAERLRDTMPVPSELLSAGPETERCAPPMEPSGTLFREPDWFWCWLARERAKAAKKGGAAGIHDRGDEAAQ